MGAMVEFKYSRLDFGLTVVGLFFLILDIVLDILALVNFYQEKAYVSFVILVLLLLGSSVLAQAFSFLWYSFKEEEKELAAKSLSLSPGKVKILHVFQFGVYLRHATVVEVSLGRLREEDPDREGFAVYLTHDLSMLRLIEAFSESAPQLVLMLTTILRQSQFDSVTVLKALGSAAAIAFSVTMYHRALRFFLPEKNKQTVVSSLVYYVWNFFLLVPRLLALALFASVLPCWVFTHFLCSWLVLFFFVWRSKTDLMDSPGGEWLYRATVGLIWYFCWFNVVEGRTRCRTLLYHGFILADIGLLCGLWCWKMLSMEQPFFHVSTPQAAAVASSVFAAYLLGLAFKMLYYYKFHPTVAKEELEGEEDELLTQRSMMVMVGEGDVEQRYPRTLSSDGELQFRAGRMESDGPAAARCNKRMKKLAGNFYS